MQNGGWLNFLLTSKHVEENSTNDLLLEPERSMAEMGKIVLNVYASLPFFLQNTGTLANLGVALARHQVWQTSSGFRNSVSPCLCGESFC